MALIDNLSKLNSSNLIGRQSADITLGDWTFSGVETFITSRVVYVPFAYHHVPNGWDPGPPETSENDYLNGIYLTSWYPDVLGVKPQGSTPTGTVFFRLVVNNALAAHQDMFTTPEWSVKSRAYCIRIWPDNPSRPWHAEGLSGVSGF